MFNERRRTSREPVPENASVAWIRIGERLYPMRIMDETDRGVGMTLCQRPPLGAGQHIVVERLRITAQVLEGVVRQVRRLDDDRWWVGVEWVKMLAPSGGAPAPMEIESRSILSSVE